MKLKLSQLSNKLNFMLKLNLVTIISRTKPSISNEKLTLHSYPSISILRIIVPCTRWEKISDSVTDVTDGPFT